MDVVCEVMKLKADRVQDYIELHENTWPDLIEALKQSGFVEEYIYNVGNLVIVIMKCESFTESVKRLLSTEVFQRWTGIVRGMLVQDEELFQSKETVIDLVPIWNLADF
jgi:L-rhamnose mutarotase